MHLYYLIEEYLKDKVREGFMKNRFFAATAVFIILFNFMSIITKAEKVKESTEKKSAELTETLGSFPISSETRQELFKAVINQTGMVEEKIRRAISVVAANSESMVIDVDYSKLSYLIAGRFPRIDIKIKKCDVDGLIIERADFQFRNVIIDMETLWNEHKIVAAEGGRAYLNAEILQKDLNDFLLMKSDKTGVINPRIELLDGKLSLSGRFKTTFFGMPLSVNVSSRGKFVIKEDAKSIHFIPDNVRVNRASLPGFVRNRVVNTINPVLDLKEQPLDIILSGIEIKKGRLLILSPEED